MRGAGRSGVVSIEWAEGIWEKVGVIRIEKKAVVFGVVYQ
jgi:hypothetical protein